MQGKDEEKPYENFICGGRAGSSGPAVFFDLCTPKTAAALNLYDYFLSGDCIELRRVPSFSIRKSASVPSRQSLPFMLLHKIIIYHSIWNCKDFIFFSHLVCANVV